MASLMMGTCKGCGHPVGMHSNQEKWMHYYHKLGPYVLSVDCKDRKMFSPGLATCPCVTPEPEESKGTKSRFSF
ncbi:MAG: hypothetical protein E6K08_07000 [Methanobacteriota archaeon]|nr:MAG: hypothetical protein E6K08_07000 [Euryarchaeota archaeon]